MANLTAANACHRKDDPGAGEEASVFSKFLPFATGVVCSTENACASAVFLNETTALTCAHAFVGKEALPKIIFACDELTQIYDADGENAFNLDETLTRASEQGIPFAKVERLISFGTFTPCPPTPVLVDDITSAYFSNREMRYTDPEAHVFTDHGMMLDGQSYEASGLDIALLKLSAPIRLVKKTPSLRWISPEHLTQMPGFSFGFHDCIQTSDGARAVIQYKKTPHEASCLRRLTAISLHQPKFDQKNGIFYTKHMSYGGDDERFVCDGLPNPTQHKFIGSLVGGMSGGPVFFLDQEGEFILGGVNAASETFNMNALINAALENIYSTSDARTFAARKTDLEPFFNKPFPLYNIFQGFTQEIIDRIHREMAVDGQAIHPSAHQLVSSEPCSSSSSSSSSAAPVITSTPEHTSLYERALMLRDLKEPGLSPVTSKKMAETVFLMLAKAGHAKAMHNYAMIQAAKSNNALAYEWFEKAASLGLEPSRRNCEKMIQDGKIGVTR